MSAATGINGLRAAQERGGEERELAWRDVASGGGVRWALVRRAKRRIAEGFYDEPAVLAVAAERLCAAMSGERRRAEAPGRRGCEVHVVEEWSRSARKRGGAWDRHR